MLFSLFQSTHPRGVRHRPLDERIAEFIFQSTHPRGVRPPHHTVPPRPRNFNPRTHVGCDEDSKAPEMSPEQFQSTHPRGVRLGERLHAVQRIAISIHAPTWGATNAYAAVNDLQRISIHAPTWGATGSVSTLSSGLLFQSTHPRGVRLNDSKMMENYNDFNPRTHVGCDLWSRGLLRRGQDFNPRTHVGCD